MAPLAQAVRPRTSCGRPPLLVDPPVLPRAAPSLSLTPIERRQWFVPVPSRVIAAVMAFGSGVLISALSFELMDEAFRYGQLDSTAIGFLGGAGVYTIANVSKRWRKPVPKARRRMGTFPVVFGKTTTGIHASL